MLSCVDTEDIIFLSLCAGGTKWIKHLQYKEVYIIMICMHYAKMKKLENTKEHIN